MDILADAFPQPELARKRFRFAAFLIDFIIFWLIAFIVGRLLGAQDVIYTEDTSLHFKLEGMTALVMLAVWFVQFPLMEGSTGQTIGKKLLRLRVEKKDLSPVNIGSSFIRQLLMPIDFFFIGLIVASTNKDKQRVGDLAAKTIVVKANSLQAAQA